MSSLSDELREAYDRGTLLEAIYSHSIDSSARAGLLPDTLRDLHNTRQIDLVRAYSELRNTPDSDVDFFLTRHIFETTIPNIDHDSSDLISCSVHLLNEAGDDLAASTVLTSLERFFRSHPERIDDGLSFIETNPCPYSAALPAVLTALTGSDFATGYTQIERLTRAESLDLRRAALAACGSLTETPSQRNARSIDRILIDAAINETDDNTLRVALISGGQLVSRGLIPETTLSTQIAEVSAKSGPATYHGLAHVLGSTSESLTVPTVSAILSTLIFVPAEHAGTLEYIGHSIERLLRQGLSAPWIQFLEEYLLAHPGSATIASFGYLSSTLVGEYPQALNRLVTRWLSNGDPILLNNLRVLLRSSRHSEVALSADIEQLTSPELAHINLVAKRAISVFFFYPESCANFLLSLADLIPTDDQSVLRSMFYDPLVLSYPRIIENTRAELTLTPRQTALLDHIEAAFNAYKTAIEDALPIPELEPSDAEREAAHRKFSREMTEAFDAARKRSPLLSVIKSSPILYGRKSVSLVDDPTTGDRHRHEIPLHSHETQMDIPRHTFIDPEGVEQLLLIWQLQADNE